MSWLALTLVTFACFALVFWVKQRQSRHPALQFPYRLRTPLLNASDRELFATLQALLAERYLVLPGVPLSELVEITALPGRTPWYQARNRLLGQRVDFLLVRRPEFTAVAAILLDSEQDAFVEALFVELGLPLIRLERERAQAFGQVQQALADAGLH